MAKSYPVSGEGTHIRVWAKSLGGSMHWLYGGVRDRETVYWTSIKQAIDKLTTGKLENTWQIEKLEWYEPPAQGRGL